MNAAETLRIKYSAFDIPKGPTGFHVYPETFQEWVGTMSIEEQTALERYVEETANRIWSERGGGHSSPEQQLEDTINAQKLIFRRSAPHPKTT